MLFHTVAERDIAAIGQATIAWQPLNIAIPHQLTVTKYYSADVIFDSLTSCELRIDCEHCRISYVRIS